VLSACCSSPAIAVGTDDGKQSGCDMPEGQSLAPFDERPGLRAVVEGEVVAAAAVGAERLPRPGLSGEGLPPGRVTACCR
jgi:hypothetical protein